MELNSFTVSDMESFLNQKPFVGGGERVEDISSTLNRLEKNLTSLKTNLERKRAKVTLADIDRKLDNIIGILNRMGSRDQLQQGYTITADTSKLSW